MPRTVKFELKGAKEFERLFKELGPRVINNVSARALRAKKLMTTRTRPKATGDSECSARRNGRPGVAHRKLEPKGSRGAS
jgi:hypothetical protein